jgi:hypothetical protein
MSSWGYTNFKCRLVPSSSKKTCPCEVRDVRPKLSLPVMPISQPKHIH